MSLFNIIYLIKYIYCITFLLGATTPSSPTESPPPGSFTYPSTVDAVAEGGTFTFNLTRAYGLDRKPIPTEKVESSLYQGDFRKISTTCDSGKQISLHFYYLLQ